MCIRDSAWAVTNIMKAKSKFGGGVKKKKNVSKKKCLKGKGLYLRPYKKRVEVLKKKNQIDGGGNN